MKKDYNKGMIIEEMKGIGTYTLDVSCLAIIYPEEAEGCLIVHEEANL